MLKKRRLKTRISATPKHFFVFFSLDKSPKMHKARDLKGLTKEGENISPKVPMKHPLYANLHHVFELQKKKFAHFDRKEQFSHL